MEWFSIEKGTDSHSAAWQSRGCPKGACGLLLYLVVPWPNYKLCGSVGSGSIAKKGKVVLFYKAPRSWYIVYFVALGNSTVTMKGCCSYRNIDCLIDFHYWASSSAKISKYSHVIKSSVFNENLSQVVHKLVPKAVQFWWVAATGWLIRYCKMHNLALNFAHELSHITISKRCIIYQNSYSS